MNIDPRLFQQVHSNGRAQYVQQDLATAVAKLDASLRRIAARMEQDVGMLSAAIQQLNTGSEQMFAAIVARIGEIERTLAALTGGAVQPNVVEGTVLEAGNAQPGDGNLPPEYFQGAEDESGVI